MNKDFMCGKCGNVMICTTPNRKYPINYYCPKCHAEAFVSNNGIIEWRDENNKQFSSTPAMLSKLKDNNET